MAQIKDVIDQYLTTGDPKKDLLYAQLVQVVFIFIGLFLTTMAFNFVNSFVQTNVKQEYESLTQDTVSVVIGRLDELENSVSHMANNLSFYKEVGRNELSVNINEFSRDLEYFDQVLWVYQSSPGKWQFKNIHTREKTPEEPRRYSINVDKQLLTSLNRQSIFSSPDVKMLKDIEFNTRGTKSELERNVRVDPFAMVKPVKQNDLEAGVVIAVGNLLTAFGHDRNTEISYLVSRLSIRDIDAGYDLYHLNKQVDGQQDSNGLGQAYEFNFAGYRCEIRAAFAKSEQVNFMESLPFFAVVLGLMITAFGLLYIRSSTSRAVQVSKVHKELEEKNIELEKEIDKRAGLNDALKQSEKENRAVIDAVSDIIFEIDTEGKILFLSASWSKVTGFDPEQSLGLELFKMLHNQDQEQQRKDFQLLVKGQKQTYRSFSRLRTSDGTFRAVEIAVSMIRQDENNNLRIVGTITDVEERRRAERALSEAEKKYRAIVENAAGGIYQLTPEGLYLSANPALARILGYESPEEILREVKNANETVYVDSKERQTLLRELEKRGSINGFETEVQKKDGARIWVNENIRVVKDDNNNVLYYEGSLEDITGRKESDLAMRDAKVQSDLANRAKSEFLANMSHELRTPLNAIIGFSEIIKNEVFGKLEQRAYWEYAKDIHESGSRLLDIINEILDISKIEAGERQLNEGLIDLNEIVESCLSLLSNKIESNKMEVTNTMEDVPQIIGEELAIKQILLNLLSNAVKYTPSGGRVTISQEIDTEGQLRLSITDTGIGLDKEEIEKALSPFGQIDNELSRSGSGTGLGLTLVDALIKLHGGEFELFSQKGLGTTATVVFPIDRVTVQKTAANVLPSETEDA